MNSLVYIAFQDTENARQYVEAITQDNPHAEVQHQPAMIRVQAAGRMELNRQTVEEKIGREWDTQEMLIEVITLGGNVEEEEDSFTLYWN